MRQIIVASLIMFGNLVTTDLSAQERTDNWGVPYVKLNNGVEMRCPALVWAHTTFRTTTASRR